MNLAILAHHDCGKLVKLHTDAGVGLGIVVIQNILRSLPLLMMVARCRELKQATLPERKCFAIYWACVKFQTYFVTRKIKVLGYHHPLCWLSTKSLTPRLDH